MSLTLLFNHAAGAAPPPAPSPSPAPEAAAASHVDGGGAGAGRNGHNPRQRFIEEQNRVAISHVIAAITGGVL